MLEKPRRLVKVPPGTIPVPAAPKEVAVKPINISELPISPTMYYYPAQCEKPGYKICELKLLLSEEEFTDMLTEIDPIGIVDGEEVVYALDYIRWKLKQEDV